MRKVFLLLIVASVLLVAPAVLCGAGGPCGFFAEEPYVYMASGAIHLGLFSIAMLFLWRGDISKTFSDLEIPGNLKKNLLYSLLGIGAIFFFLFLFSFAAVALGINDEQLVAEKVASLPIYVLAFAILVAPISEELFFRALLVPRIGMVFSSVFFGLVHFAYGSVVEILGAMLIGLILAGIFRSSRSITPCILIHMTYNLISIAVMRLFL